MAPRPWAPEASQRRSRRRHHSPCCVQQSTAGHSAGWSQHQHEPHIRCSNEAPSDRRCGKHARQPRLGAAPCVSAAWGAPKPHRGQGKALPHLTALGWECQLRGRRAHSPRSAACINALQLWALQRLQGDLQDTVRHAQAAQGLALSMARWHRKGGSACAARQQHAPAPAWACPPAGHTVLATCRRTQSGVRQLGPCAWRKAASIAAAFSIGLQACLMRTLMPKSWPSVEMASNFCSSCSLAPSSDWISCTARSLPLRSKSPQQPAPAHATSLAHMRHACGAALHAVRAFTHLVDVAPFNWRAAEAHKQHSL